MDKAKILRLCNDIEDIVNELAALCDIVDLHTHSAIMDKIRAIAAEITAPPKTNADRIRQMTDEELVELVNSCVCNYTDKCLDNDCEECGMKWVKAEVSEDAAD